MTEFIVCGCCTAEGPHRAAPLRRRLDDLGTRHDLVETDMPGDPDTNAPGRPFQIRAAMDRHPGRTILFIDAGCRIVGTRDDLMRAADIPGDIALHVGTGRYPDGRRRLVPHAETLVLRPTARAYVFVKAWIETWKRSAGTDAEQDLLAAALARVPELCVTFLGAEFCTTEENAHPLPVIVHACARTAGTINRWERPNTARRPSS